MDQIEKEVIDYFKKWSEKVKEGSIKISVKRAKMVFDDVKKDIECLTYDEEGRVIYHYDTYYVRRDLTYTSYNRFIDLNEELNEDPLDLRKPGYESLPYEDEIDDLDDLDLDEIDEDNLLSEEETMFLDGVDKEEYERFLKKLNEEEKLEERIKKMN